VGVVADILCARPETAAAANTATADSKKRVELIFDTVLMVLID
jgi:hypothetical protein